MVKSVGRVGTLPTLFICLLVLSVIILTSLYFETRQHNALLMQDIDRLKKSQVLLMVPDDQAEAVANWMADHPGATQTLLSKAKPGEQVKLEVGPGVNSNVDKRHSPMSPLIATDIHNDDVAAQVQQPTVEPAVLNHTIVNQENGNAVSSTTDDLSLHNNVELVVSETDMTQEEAISENKDGVKIISLPHGGIRVTTRENN